MKRTSPLIFSGLVFLKKIEGRIYKCISVYHKLKGKILHEGFNFSGFCFLFYDLYYYRVRLARSILWLV